MGSHSNQLTLFVFKYGPAWVRRSIVRQLGSRDPSVANRLLSLAIRDRNRSVRLTALEVIAASAYAWGQYRSRVYRRIVDRSLLSALGAFF